MLRFPCIRYPSYITLWSSLSGRPGVITTNPNTGVKAASTDHSRSSGQPAPITAGRQGSQHRSQQVVRAASTDHSRSSGQPAPITAGRQGSQHRSQQVVKAASTDHSRSLGSQHRSQQVAGQPAPITAGRWAASTDHSRSLAHECRRPISQEVPASSPIYINQSATFCGRGVSHHSFPYLDNNKSTLLHQWIYVLHCKKTIIDFQLTINDPSGDEDGRITIKHYNPAIR